ncbi:Uncharacterised protein [uncultured archaeon]|nr:Uncharacterised protein [uncultured archaeon]
MKEKIAIFSAILLGMIVGLFATISLIIDAFIIYNPVATFIDIILMGVGYITAWIGIWHILKKKIANDKMNMYWNRKIQPLVNILVDSVGRMDAIGNEITENNHKIDTTSDYIAKMHGMEASSVYILPGVSFKLATKVLVLMTFIICGLVYFAKSLALDFIPIYILVFYLLWWGLFTSEYCLYNNKTAWIWALAPIMTVPVGGVILNATWGPNIMVSILFGIMFFYVYFYYSWGAQLVFGFKLSKNNKIRNYIINNNDAYFQKKKVEHKINRKWIDAGILACIAIAGSIAIWIFV